MRKIIDHAMWFTKRTTNVRCLALIGVWCKFDATFQFNRKHG